MGRVLAIDVYVCYRHNPRMEKENSEKDTACGSAATFFDVHETAASRWGFRVLVTVVKIIVERANNDL